MNKENLENEIRELKSKVAALQIFLLFTCVRIPGLTIKDLEEIKKIIFSFREVKPPIGFLSSEIKEKDFVAWIGKEIHVLCNGAIEVKKFHKQTSSD